MMKKFKILLMTALAMFGFLGLSTGAPVAAFELFPSKTCKKAQTQTSNLENPTVCEDNKTGQTTSNNALYGTNGIITRVANLLAIVVAIAAVIVIIVSGIQYMLSRGDPTKIVNAKNAILYALAGLVVALLARTIIIFVVSKL